MTMYLVLAVSICAWGILGSCIAASFLPLIQGSDNKDPHPICWNLDGGTEPHQELIEGCRFWEVGGVLVLTLF
jgi:hypothetical protein